MSGTGYEFGAALGSTVRAGDADREATVEQLRRHHAEGRIDVSEFQERLDRAYEAKTFGELRELVSDLPHEPAHGGQLGRSSRLRARSMLAWVPLLLLVIAVSALPGHHHGGPWMLIPLFFLARFLLWGRRPWGRRRRQLPHA